MVASTLRVQPARPERIPNVKPCVEQSIRGIGRVAAIDLCRRGKLVWSGFGTRRLPATRAGRYGWPGSSSPQAAPVADRGRSRIEVPVDSGLSDSADPDSCGLRTVGHGNRR